MLNGLEFRVRNTIRNYGMLADGEHVLVAVSGGPDSTALLHILHALTKELHLRLTVAHLNHCIRGTEGDADQDFVRRMSAGLDLPFILEVIDIKRESQEQQRNLEELARQRRYEFLRRAAGEAGAQKIAVGHTLNDQAETILFRLMRGSGLEGLSAIHPIVESVLIRPLIECSRESILQYGKEMGIPYREDSSNKDLRHARNRIRGQLLPYMETHFNPQVASTLAREALLARETWSYVDSRAKEYYEQIHRASDEYILLSTPELLKIHPALQKQVLRQAVRECLGSLRGIAALHIDSLLALCGDERSGARVQLPHGCLALRQFDAILLYRKFPEPARSFAYDLSIPGSCFVPEAGAFFASEICSAPDPRTMRERCAFQAFLDRSELPASLVVRSRVPGDRYGGGDHRKVKKMLIDGKIPLAQRSTLPMVVAGNDVVWIPGFRPAHSCEARAGSTECIAITMTRKDYATRGQ
jgi:tRNA(Ile)-lysidine synthase